MLANLTLGLFHDFSYTQINGCRALSIKNNRVPLKHIAMRRFRMDFYITGCNIRYGLLYYQGEIECIVLHCIVLPEMSIAILGW